MIYQRSQYQSARKRGGTDIYKQLQINNPFNSALNTIIHVLGGTPAGDYPCRNTFCKRTSQSDFGETGFAHEIFYQEHQLSPAGDPIVTYTYLLIKGTILSLLYFMTCTAQLYLWINKWQTPSIYFSYNFLQKGTSVLIFKIDLLHYLSPSETSFHYFN